MPADARSRETLDDACRHMPIARRAMGGLSLVLVLAWLAPSGTGCRPGQEQPSRPGATAETSDNQPGAQDDQNVVAQRETWDAVYLGRAQSGFVHTVFETLLQDDGQTMIRVSLVTELSVRRFQENAQIQMRMMSLETPQGAVRRFRVETLSGPTPVVVAGVHHAGEMQLLVTTQGKQVRRSLPWDESTGGLFALEQSLSRQPMQPGEERRLTTLMPDISGVQVVTHTLHAEALETVDLLDGSAELLKTSISTVMGDHTLDSMCWCTPTGEILKSSIPDLQQTTYRTTRARAQAKEDGEHYDLGLDSIVKLDAPLPDPQHLTRAEYEVSLARGDPAELFASGGSQIVRRIDPTRAHLVVLAVRPGSPLTGVPDPPPGPDDLASSSLIQADDPEVVKMAREAIGAETDDWKKCVAWERAVRDTIHIKGYGQGFATAADVVRTREGDCTEHAVLLAALCRAGGVAARVAWGLVYSPAHQGFAFHMWNEAWVSDRWIPLDATAGQGGIGCGHVKLSHSSLAGHGEQDAAWTVLQVIHQLKIDAINFEPK